MPGPEAGTCPDADLSGDAAEAADATDATDARTETAPDPEPGSAPRTAAQPAPAAGAPDASATPERAPGPGPTPAPGSTPTAEGAPEDDSTSAPEPEPEPVLRADAAPLSEPALHLALPDPGPEPHAPEPEVALPAGRPWARPLLISVTALAAMAVLTLATIVQSPSAKAGSDSSSTADTSVPKATATQPAQPSATPAPTSTRTTTAATTPPATATAAAAARTTASPDAAVTQAVRALGVSGNLSVAVTDADGGASATYDSSGDTSYDTASIVKVDILATLLLQDQHAGTHPTAEQQSLATAMIERSDNDAALDLWHDIGRGAGLAAANKTLGLHHTVGGDGDLWGLTQTTASDQIALLRAVFDSGSPLSSSSRAYVSGLMRSVIGGERWGVSAADSDGSGYALKNGWLQRSATGLWDINSIGEVTYDGHRLLVSVLSSGQHSEQGAIDQVERVAATAAAAYVGAS
jgi:hypothetical protein